MVIQFVNYVNTGGARRHGGARCPRPSSSATAPVWVLTGGQLVEGTWARADRRTLTAYTDAAGAPIALTPGRTWVALPMIGAATVLA